MPSAIKKWRLASLCTCTSVRNWPISTWASVAGHHLSFVWNGIQVTAQVTYLDDGDDRGRNDDGGGGGEGGGGGGKGSGGDCCLLVA